MPSGMSMTAPLDHGWRPMALRATASLSDLGRREGALAAAQEAVEVYRGLAKDRPDAFLPDLARSLGTLGTCFRAANRRDDALRAFADGVRTLKPAFLAHTEAFAPLMGALARDYIMLSTEVGEAPDMELLAPILARFEEMRGKE
jgi:hypothetical protein